ncbi:MAG: DUF4350 domain-containing protein [Planctomycetes bacterium]|nr:DUF4350 domain-containing protein [Planctomycetota bacterium]
MIRRLPWIAGALFLGGLLAWLSRDPKVRREAFRDYSIYNSSGKGLSLAYRYLSSTGRAVEALARPVERAFLPADGVLFRIRPEAHPENLEEPDSKAVGLRPAHAWDEKDPARYAFSAEEEDWVRNGGRLVIAIDRRYGPIDVKEVSASPTRRVFPSWSGVERLDPPAPRGLTGLPPGEGVSVFAAGAGAVVSRLRRGRGEIILSSAPEIFQNRLLPRADHLALLDRLAGSGRPVFFDEYVHGAQGGAGTVEILRQWGFGPFLVLILVAALASFWRRRVRVGPEEDDARETRIEAVDFVDSLALLYRRMMPRRHALTLYAKEFERAVAAQTGLRDAALKARVADFLPPRPARPVRGKDLPVPDFEKELEHINLAFRRLNDAKRPGSGRPSAAGARPA